MGGVVKPLAELNKNITNNQKDIKNCLESKKKAKISKAMSLAGVRLLHDYYSSKLKGNISPYFVVDLPHNVQYLLSALPNEPLLGFVMLNHIGTHFTPILLRQGANEFDLVSVDSIGDLISEISTGVNKLLNSVSDQIKKVHGGETRINTYKIRVTRQWDDTSCGSDAHLVMKQALLLKDALFTFVEENANQSGICYVCPVEILKYSQSRRHISARYNQDGKYQGRYVLQQDESLDEKLLIKRKNSVETVESLADYFQRHQNDNIITRTSTLSIRAQKHKNIEHDYYENSTKTRLKVLVSEASGLSGILKAPKKSYWHLYRSENIWQSEDKLTNLIMEKIGLKQKISIDNQKLRVEHYDRLKNPKNRNMIIASLNMLLEHEVDQLLEKLIQRDYRYLSYRTDNNESYACELASHDFDKIACIIVLKEKIQERQYSKPEEKRHFPSIRHSENSRKPLTEIKSTNNRLLFSNKKKPPTAPAIKTENINSTPHL